MWETEQFWGTIDFHSIFFFLLIEVNGAPKPPDYKLILQISSFVFGRTKKFTQVWNYLRVSKWWQNFHFWVNYPFNERKKNPISKPFCRKMLILHRFQPEVHVCCNRTLKQSATSSPLGIHGFTATITAITWKHTALHPLERSRSNELRIRRAATHTCTHPVDERELTANKQHLAKGRVLFLSITNWLMAQYLVGKEERGTERYRRETSSIIPSGKSC